MKAKKRFGFVLILVILLALLTASIFFTRIWLPAQLVDDFGPADPGLGLFNRVRYAFNLYQNQTTLLEVPSADAIERKFSIDLAEPVGSVCARLEAEGYVRSGELACTFLIYSGLDRQIQAGTFTLSSNQNSVAIARKIGDASQRDIAFTIFPGWRLEEVGQAVEMHNFSFSPAEFITYASNPPEYLQQALALPSGASLEGFLYPAFYSFKPDISLEDMVRTILTEFSLNILDENFQNGIEQEGISPYQAVILASIIQRETANAAEMPTIASVFYNRLDIDMRLQTDPTVQYSLGYDPAGNTWWRQLLSFDDLEVDSPYNTYQVTGLPPGPICSPGMESLLAVAMPEETPYFFFRAKCDASMTHDFSVTYEEHLNKACP